MLIDSVIPWFHGKIIVLNTWGQSGDIQKYTVCDRRDAWKTYKEMNTCNIYIQLIDVKGVPFK